MIRQPSRHCTVELQAVPARIGHVRRIVSAQLRHWRLDALIDPAALGVTELLANVHRHARPSKHCTVELCVLLDQLTVSVHDEDPRLPRIRVAESWETCGRGLALIAALSESWGVRPDGGGKVVWFTLPALTTPPEEARTVCGYGEPVPLEDARTVAGPHTRIRGTRVG
ncbi:ATP-binding protein [Streptomyces platensis]|uniref:ATP-binding protein n=1 Tax=Streptomyces platensis TaxID=58346 RepID=UPI002E131C5B|nr:ATP-binding protein [Streptomyces platensis]